MKKKVVIILGVIIALMIACTFIYSKDVDENIKVDKTLTGESENWEATYIVKGYTKFWTNDEGTTEFDMNSKYELVIKYKGTLENLNDMRIIKIGTRGSTSERTSSGPPTNIEFNKQGSVPYNTLYDIYNGKGVNITVSWDGENGGVEDIDLK